MPEIAFIMGKSASGKDKIFKSLLADETLNLKTITMYTTRPMRNGETDGAEYYFVDDETACRIERTYKIVEMRRYHTILGEWKYFTADDGQVDLNSGNHYIVIGTLEAYSQFCTFYGKEHILPIYIDVEDDIRLERAIKREKKQENPRFDEVCRRFLADNEDFSEENIQRAGIQRRFYNNGCLEDCICEVKNAIIKGVIGL